MDRFSLQFQVLERQHDLIRRSDAKILITVPTATAMLGGFAIALANVTSPNLPSVILYAMVSVSLFCVFVFSFLALNPSVSHPRFGYRIYAGHIVNETLENYIQSWKEATDEEILEDISTQIHINAAIAMMKLKYISRSLSCLLFSIPLWTLAIYRISQ